MNRSFSRNNYDLNETGRAPPKAEKLNRLPVKHVAKQHCTKYIIHKVSQLLSQTVTGSCFKTVPTVAFNNNIIASWPKVPQRLIYNVEHKNCTRDLNPRVHQTM